MRGRVVWILVALGLFSAACGLPASMTEPGAGTRTTPSTTHGSEEAARAPTATVSETAEPPLRPLPPIRGTPDVTFVAGSLEEAKRQGEAWFRRYTQCLIDGNWPVTMNSAVDGFTVGSIPAEQRAAFWEADIECQQRAGPRPVAPPATEEEIAEIYRQLLGVASCLRAQGYEIDPAPSLEAFIDSYETGPWHPYLSLPDDISAAEWNRLERVCPQP